MTNEIDDFAADLQSRIDEETILTYGRTVFERWRSPLFMGRLENADGQSSNTGACGDTMQLFLRFEDGRVKEASFLTDGCGCSMACGSFAAELALGKTPDELAGITGESILQRSGPLPAEDRHCAFLAAETLQSALENHMKKGSEKMR